MAAGDFLKRTANGGSTNPRTPFAPAGPIWSPIKDSGDHVEFYTLRGTISTAQLLALNATPQTIVAAPGALKYLTLEHLHLWLDYNSAAYAGIAAGEDLSVKYTNGSGAEAARVETTGFLDATADAHRIVRPTASISAVADVTPVVNSPLVLCLLSGEITTGNSPLKYSVTYAVRDLEW